MHRHVTLAAGLHFARPAHEEGDADAAFVGRAFAFAQRRILRHAGEAAVVAGEDHEGVVAELEFIEFCEQAAHFVVEMLQHGEVVGDGALGGFAFVVRRAFEASGDVFGDQGFGCFQLGVRAEMGSEREPGFAAIGFDEADDVIGDGGDGFVFVMFVAIRRTGEVEAVGVKVALALP
jgi:hypothetical protein